MASIYGDDQNAEQNRYDQITKLYQDLEKIKNKDGNNSQYPSSYKNVLNAQKKRQEQN